MYLIKILPKAKISPKKVCKSHHHDQESIVGLACMLFSALHLDLLQEYANICSSARCKTYHSCLLYAIPIHHLHSKKQTKHTVINEIKCFKILWYICDHQISARLYLVTVDISKHLFTMLFSEYLLKMSCDIETKHLRKKHSSIVSFLRVWSMAQTT